MATEIVKDVINRSAELDVTIASGASLSGEVDLDGYRLVAIQMPAAWDAANLTFQGSADAGAAYANAYDASGNEITVTAAASRFIVVSPDLFYHGGRLKIRSGTSGVPVNQTAARTLKVLLRKD